MKPFGMHVVVFDVIFADGLEGAKTDVKGKIADLNTFVLEILEEGFGEI